MALVKTPKEIETHSAAVIPPNFEERRVEKGTSLAADSIRKFRQNKMAVISVITIAFFYIVSLSASWIAPYSFDQGLLDAQDYPPTWYRAFMSDDFKTASLAWARAEAEDDAISLDDFGEGGVALEQTDAPAGAVTKPVPVNMWDRSIDHLTQPQVENYLAEAGLFDHVMGTDEIGQDIFSRVIFGMRLSLFLALTVTFVSVIIGISYGAISGYFGGMLDAVMMRFVDFLFGIPFIFLVILLMVFFGREVFLIFVGLGLVYWIVLARIVRGQILSLKTKEYVLAAKSNGVSELAIIFRHLVPNVLGPVIVFSTLLVPQIMLLEAFLSFIGLGVSPPDVSLGILISDGAAVVSSFSWPILYPGIVFSIMIFCMNFIGDGLRDALDPKSLK